jgi:hypothetical protein
MVVAVGEAFANEFYCGHAWRRTVSADSRILLTFLLVAVAILLRVLKEGVPQSPLSSSSLLKLLLAQPAALVVKAARGHRGQLNPFDVRCAPNFCCCTGKWTSCQLPERMELRPLVFT